MSSWVTREVTSQERKPARGRFPERGKTAAVAPARAGSAKPATGGRISPGQVPPPPPRPPKGRRARLGQEKLVEHREVRAGGQTARGVPRSAEGASGPVLVIALAPVPPHPCTPLPGLPLLCVFPPTAFLG